MTDNLSTQKHVVQHEFTRQATAYAALPSVSDPVLIDRLIQAVDPSPAARVLDVATGRVSSSRGTAHRSLPWMRSRLVVPFARTPTGLPRAQEL